MPVQVSVTSAANADLIQAFDWYERQSPGLGMAFVQEVDAAMVRIVRHPRLWAPAYRDLRRVFTRRLDKRQLAKIRVPSAWSLSVLSV